MFTDVAGSSGLDFHHFTGATGEYHFPEIMGSGCAFLDYDGDGDLDVYLLQGALLEPGVSLSDAVFPPRAPAPIRNRLYRNDLSSDGRLRFVDVTEESGAGDTAHAMGVATGDYDNDGDVDLYVTNIGPDVLLRNNADGTFTDVTAAAGLGDPRWTTSAAFLDYDRDGYLDLFVTAYVDFTPATNKECFLESGARDYCNPKAYLPIPGRLYRNRGDGSFIDVSAPSGVDAVYGHGLGVVAGDFDGNGWVDVYVANDGDANQLWMNEGGVFTDEALLAGAAFNEHGVAEAGMGIAPGDHDGDGDLDLFLTHLNGESNRLLENLGGAMFEDVTARRGLGQPSLPFTGFGVGWIDVNHDAHLDLLIANGDVAMIESQIGESYPYHQTNQIMINDGQGKFRDATPEAGSALALSEVSRGLALGDVDNDGDVDALISNNAGPARLLRNELRDKGSWILLRVLDRSLGRDASGSAVRLTLTDGRVLVRHVRTDGSYLSASDPRLHFAWPAGPVIRSMQLLTPEGRTEPLEPVELGTVSTVMVDAFRRGE